MMEANDSQVQDFMEDERPILDFSMFKNEMISGYQEIQEQVHLSIFSII